MSLTHKKTTQNEKETIKIINSEKCDFPTKYRCLRCVLEFVFQGLFGFPFGHYFTLRFQGGEPPRVLLSTSLWALPMMKSATGSTMENGEKWPTSQITTLLIYSKSSNGTPPKHSLTEEGLPMPRARTTCGEPASLSILKSASIPSRSRPRTCLAKNIPEPKRLGLHNKVSWIHRSIRY